ncbi:type II toxin-antitoxin system VapC family toxin [Haloarcula nitratireducens]|uniref:Ribonuclease VapC n=1 Tax=Haloarcula nitratireducens TaxID=2487749 RepID=A0AAW4PBY5_9EURY|nr:type II toxin-antitoxin system VapC family toxin [Halomicroarcula nitratireducens]MBX0294980.1 type II toxin-antitoxin system VapC family toxin [Halomicroarcula nitratireducens]
MKLVDTSVVVDIDRGGVDQRVSKLDGEGRHAISVVTLTELRMGVNKQYEGDTEAHGEAMEALERLCARFETVDVTRPVAVRAADIIAELQRRGEPLHDLHDVYIAATAMSEELPVLTASVDRFERIGDVRVVDWADY